MKDLPIVSRPLNFNQRYPCPSCRVGKIETMPLMEAMFCDFCQEIFTVNLQSQQVKMPSRQPPLIWHWNGYNWDQGQIEGMELGWGYAVAGIAFVMVPTFLIGISAYYLPSSPMLFWIPYIWTLLTFVLHLAIVIWVFIEIYQTPLAAYWRAVARWVSSDE